MVVAILEFYSFEVALVLSDSFLRCQLDCYDEHLFCIFSRILKAGTELRATSIDGYFTSHCLVVTLDFSAIHVMVVIIFTYMNIQRNVKFFCKVPTLEVTDRTEFCY